MMGTILVLSTEWSCVSVSKRFRGVTLTLTLTLHAVNVQANNIR